MMRGGQHRRADQRQAFTLIEVLASILVFALGVMAVVSVITQGLRTSMLAQSDSTAWPTALSLLRDPVPLGGSDDPASGLLTRWTWARSGNSWVATEAGGTDDVWRATTWGIDQGSDLLVPDMGAPQVNNPLVFPSNGMPLPGCARGWLNGYYVERREQSRAVDRIGQGVRMVEVRVDVYWANAFSGDARPLASAIDRFIRQEMP